MRKLITLLAALTLVAPLMFYGCSGDDGSAGPKGDQGNPGLTGPPGTGVVAEETCVLCHSAGQAFDVNNMHRLNPTGTLAGERKSPGSATVTINSVVFGATAGDNVPVTVNFTFAATNQDNANVTSQIDLRTLGTGTSAGQLNFLRFTLAKMVAGQNGDANEWNVAFHRPGQTGSGPFYENNPAGITGDPATGVYNYVFPDNSVRVSDIGSLDNSVVRLVVEARNLPITVFTPDPFYDTNTRRVVTHEHLDSVAPIGGGTGVPLALGDGRPRKNDVSTAACNACHDPLAVHGGSRRDYQFCATCHNAKLETHETLESDGTIVPNDNLNLVNLIHKVHNDNLAVASFNEAFDRRDEPVTYPQDIRNCRKCHQGTEADNTYDNWMNKPTRTACGACHINVNFATGANHVGGAQATNAGCSSCHPASAIPGYHANENATPNNLALLGTLVSFEYRIDNVTVDNNNVATIKFAIMQDNVLANLGNAGDNVTRPTGFTTATQPSFLFAYAMPQDGIAAPVDYNNLGKAAGQPESLSIVGLPIVAKDNTSYTVTRANAFPVGAKMRAVALQGYFTQLNGADTNNDGALDNVGRHTFSVVRNVTGDATRRVAVESGYTNNNNPFTGQPVGCLECHEIFEGHGGNRVSNAQVCVMCHNPNLSSSGRTIDPAVLTSPTASPTAKAIVAGYGSNPLTYPEVTNNFKELIHGIHGAQKRTTNFVDIRGDRLALIEGDEITYPGDLSHCGKCHLNNLYQNIQTTGRLLSTVNTTYGADNNIRTQIIAARASVPNATDNVNTPAASACGHCHDSVTARSHFVAMGGEVRAPRGSAVLIPPPLAPDLTP
jgi:OmcA/MtrC family decaheme c-type cytochrome